MYHDLHSFPGFYLRCQRGVHWANTCYSQMGIHWQPAEGLPGKMADAPSNNRCHHPEG